MITLKLIQKLIIFVDLILLKIIIFNIIKKMSGFKIEHFERNGHNDHTIKRCLVFMTYLNDLDLGGTIFPYQNRTVKAQKGKTVIFPADWTHTHVGQISETKKKLLMVGIVIFGNNKWICLQPMYK